VVLALDVASCNKGLGRHNIQPAKPLNHAVTRDLFNSCQIVF
jgi:hypothetical protein